MINKSFEADKLMKNTICTGLARAMEDRNLTNSLYYFIMEKFQGAFEKFSDEGRRNELLSGLFTGLKHEIDDFSSDSIKNSMNNLKNLRKEFIKTTG
jgi:hypothetical protein